jgi:hypothetical protein
MGLSVAEVMGSVVLRNERPQLPDTFYEQQQQAETALTMVHSGGLMQRCLEAKPKKRPTFDEIIRFLNDVKNILP